MIWFPVDHSSIQYAPAHPIPSGTVQVWFCRGGAAGNDENIRGKVSPQDTSGDTTHRAAAVKSRTHCSEPGMRCERGVQAIAAFCDQRPDGHCLQGSTSCSQPQVLRGDVIRATRKNSHIEISPADIEAYQGSGTSYKGCTISLEIERAASERLSSSNIDF